MIASLLVLVGCAAPTPSGQSGGSAAVQEQAAIDKYVAAQQSQAAKVMSDNPGEFSSVTIESLAADSVTFTYTFAKPMDAAASAKNFDGLVPSLKSAADKGVFPGLRLDGAKGTLHATYAYVNSDGSTIWQKTFVSS